MHLAESARRRIRCLTVTIAALCTVALGLPATAADTEKSVRVENTHQVVDAFGAYIVTGELVNGTGYAVNASIEIGPRGRSSGPEMAYPALSILDDGERSAFKIRLFLNYGESVFYQPVWSQSVYPADHRFTVTTTSTTRDANGRSRVVGTVRNDNRTAVHTPTVHATFFDSAGRVVDTEGTYPATAQGTVTEPGDFMAAGAVGTFDITRHEGSPDESVALIGESPDEPTPLPIDFSLDGSCTGPTYRYGLAGGVSGRIIKHGTRSGVGGVRVQLLRRQAGSQSWRLRATRTTDDAGGGVTFGITDQVNTTYKLRALASTTVPRAETPPCPINVYAAVSVALKPKTLAKGKLAKLTTVVAPNEAGRRVTLERLIAVPDPDLRGAFRYKWKAVDSHKLNRKSSYTFTIKATKKGDHLYRTRVGAITTNGAGKSRKVTLRVR